MMKLRFLVLFFLSFLFNQNNYASDSNNLVNRVIPNASVIISRFVGDDSSGFQNKTGFGIGATTDIGRSELVFETGILYQQLGATAKNDNLNVSIDLNYLSVPLEAKLYLSGQNTSSLYLKGGLMPSFLTSKNLTVSNSIVAVSTSDLLVNDFDLRGVIGIGAKIDLNQRAALVLESTYMTGITKVSSTNEDVHNSAITFTSGLAIEI